MSGKNRKPRNCEKITGVGELPRVVAQFPAQVCLPSLVSARVSASGGFAASHGSHDIDRVPAQKGQFPASRLLPLTRLLGARDFLAAARGGVLGRLTPNAFSNNSCSSFFSAAVTDLVKFC